MNDRERRLKSVQSQLLEIYEDLFGVQYKSTGDVDEGTQFKAILERFREKHFYVRQMQKDREKKQKKGNGKLTEQLLKNQKIRQEIKMCDNLLKQAQERIKNGIGKQDKNKYDKTLKSRRIMLDECKQMLNNLKTVEYGQSFQPKKQHQTLDQFKKRLIEQAPQEINLQEQQALQRFKRKDEDIEGVITELRDVNTLVKGNLLTANEHIKVTQSMIENNMKVADRVGTKIEKGTADLRQVLKNYRRPSKLCLDVILVLLLLALIGVIINMLKGSIL